MRTRKWSILLIVAVLAVTGRPALAQDHRGGWQSQGQPQINITELIFQPQAGHNRADQYTENNGFR